MFVAGCDCWWVCDSGLGDFQQVIPRGCTEFELQRRKKSLSFLMFVLVGYVWEFGEKVTMLDLEDLSNLIAALETARDCEK